jgi:hypothetical protein
MIEELPVAKEIEEPLLEIVVADSISIENQRYIYNRNAREISIMLSITSFIIIFYVLYIFCQYLI